MYTTTCGHKDKLFTSKKGLLNCMETNSHIVAWWGEFYVFGCLTNLMPQLDSWEWDVNQLYFDIPLPLYSFFGIPTSLTSVAMLTLGPYVLGL